MYNTFASLQVLYNLGNIPTTSLIFLASSGQSSPCLVFSLKNSQAANEKCSTKIDFLQKAVLI